MAGFSEIGISIEKRFEEKIKNDSKIKTILAKIDEGKADMNDMSEYSRRLGYLARQSIYGVYKEELNDRPKWSDVQYIVENILRQNYDNINELEARVQKSLDNKAGIGLKPLQGDFPAERVSTVIGAASNAENAEQAIRRMCSPTENITASFHADYIKKNAEFRSKAGLNCYIERTTDGKCCDWCSKLAGRYRYPDEVPKDVYRRHDNCTCDVSYVSEKGRQNVHTRQWTNEQAKAQRIEYAASVPKPMKLTKAEAIAKESEILAQRRLTYDAKRGIIKTKEVGYLKQAKKRDHKVFITDTAISKVDKVVPSDFTDEQAEKMQQMHKKLLSISKNENNSNEVLIITGCDFSSEVIVKGGEFNVAPASNPFAVSVVAHSDRQSLVYLHNHPSTNTFSVGDIDTFCCERAVKMLTVVTNQGEVYIINKTGKYSFSDTRKILTDIRDSFPDGEIDDKAFVEKYLKECHKGGVEYVKAK